ncbi:aminotransferase class I/II-fold pyridoxal phosphate-dependent enzyme [candidate division KSB1 bacterium]|nr:aminotransferase class I/II-fold pyridoxal phosphate-dependent enzyme [candidate division KSB1 bacterium]
MKNEEGPSTRSVHLAKQRDPLYRTIVPPVVENTAFSFSDLDIWRKVAFREEPGDIYSRNSNPTTTVFDEKMAALEGAESAVSFATGMAAISTTLFALLRPSKRVVAIKDAYGGTYLHFTEILPAFGIECNVVDSDDHREIESSISKGCDLVYLESPTNPTLKIFDIERLSKAAHNAGAIAVVDNTFATPINQNPLALGADLVLHSATKFLGGHGDALGGVVCGGSELIDKIYRYRELTGPSLNAHNAYLLLRSLKTLGLRIQRHNENALEIAQFLEDHPGVTKVYYPGLKSHPGHEVAKKQMSGFGGVLSFELQGGLEAVSKFLPKLKYAYLAANLGQVETIAGPPSLTSHIELTAEEREKAGIPEGLIRYSAGIEDVEDLKSDLQQAFDSI